MADGYDDSDDIYGEPKDVRKELDAEIRRLEEEMSTTEDEREYAELRKELERVEEERAEAEHRIERWAEITDEDEYPPENMPAPPPEPRD